MTERLQNQFKGNSMKDAEILTQFEEKIDGIVKSALTQKKKQPHFQMSQFIRRELIKTTYQDCAD